MIIRRQYIFYGHVQGVGFRYRAYHAANALGLGGFVRNLSDGSVEMEVEGPEEAIDQLILTIESGRYIVIENLSCKNIPVQGESYFRYGD